MPNCSEKVIAFIISPKHEWAHGPVLWPALGIIPLVSLPSPVVFSPCPSRWVFFLKHSRKYTAKLSLLPIFQPGRVYLSQQWLSYFKHFCSLLWKLPGKQTTWAFVSKLYNSVFGEWFFLTFGNGQKAFGTHSKWDDELPLEVGLKMRYNLTVMTEVFSWPAKGCLTGVPGSGSITQVEAWGEHMEVMEPLLMTSRLLRVQPRR